MSYVDENLISGEEVRYRARLHWIALFHYYVAALLVAASGAVLVGVGVSQETGAASIAGVVLLVAGVALAVVAALLRGSAEFAITNKRVIIKTGIIQRRTSEMFLAKIETVGVDQGLLARMLDYGTISVRGTGGTAEPFTRIARPLEFRRQVQEQMARMMGA